MVIDELHKVIDEYNKLAQEKKDWQILIMETHIQVDLLTEELKKVKMQLNNIRKSPNHSSVRSNKTPLCKRDSHNHNFMDQINPLQIILLLILPLKLFVLLVVI